MELAAVDRLEGAHETPLQENRAAPRFFALIRSAKLVSPQGEFVCVVRDVSESGVRLRCFHSVPPTHSMGLELQNGDIFEIERVRENGEEASFRFAVPVPIQRLVQEATPFPRRPLRLNLAVPLKLRMSTGAVAAVTHNMSQQGCRVEADLPLALGQEVLIDSPHLPPIRAKVRWRRDGELGLVFDDTFSLREFAIHAARLQCPALVAA